MKIEEESVREAYRVLLINLAIIIGFMFLLLYLMVHLYKSEKQY